MTEPWDDPEPQPLDLSALSIVDSPVEHVVPNHRASDEWQSTEDKPRRKTVRERLMGKTDSTPVPVRNVKPPKERKHVPNKPGQFVQPVEDFYNMVALVLMPFKPEVSLTIMSPAGPSTEDDAEPPTVAQNCAKAWDEAAQRSETIRNFLDGFMTVGVVGQLIAAHTPIVLAMMPNSSRFNPAAAMEEMLKRRAEEQSG